VSVATTRKDGFVMRIRSMLGNPYDGHTLREALEQVAFLSKIRPKQAFVDRGYHGLGVETTTGYIAGQKLDEAWPPRALRHQGHARGSDPCRPLPLRPQRSHDPRPPQSALGQNRGRVLRNVRNKEPPHHGLKRPQPACSVTGGAYEAT
jgi:hypothetical protein